MAAVEDEGFRVVKGRKKRNVYRAPVKLTPAIPKQGLNALGSGSAMEMVAAARTPAKIYWVGVICANGGYCLAQDDLKLGDYVAPTPDENSELFVIADEDEVEKNKSYWSSSVLLYSIGKKPFFPYLKRYVEKVLKPTKPFIIYSKAKGVFLVRFESEEDATNIAMGGPYWFDGNLLVVKKWVAKVAVEREMLSSMPLWVRLRGIREHIWSTKILTKIASRVGIPLRMDPRTENGLAMEYA